MSNENVAVSNGKSKSRNIEATKRARYPQRYVVVQSKTGRAFNRVGRRFESTYGTPIDLETLTDVQKAELCEELHLAVSFVDREHYDQAVEDFATLSAGAGGGVGSEDTGVTDAQLRAENAKLLDENEALRNEVSLLKGRLHQPPSTMSPIGG